MSQGKIHDAVMEWIRLRPLIALQKLDGGVREIVGNILRRLVARTMAKQIAKKAGESHSPFQNAGVRFDLQEDGDQVLPFVR